MAQMKVQELMERCDLTQTGRAIAYIKDGLVEMNTITETNIMTLDLDITKDQRFYDLPLNRIQILDVRCKNHLNAKDEYRSIPRAIGNISHKDADGQ
tara:strand:- start:153 stop:443 length:291 start_codon:yes stop_codon:yes gene_type:complete